MTVAYAHLARISRGQDRDRRMTWYYWACRAGEILAPAVGIAGAGKVVDSTSQLFSFNPFTIPPFAMLVTFGVSFLLQLIYLYKTRQEPNNPTLVHAVGLLDDDGPVNLTRPGRYAFGLCLAFSVFLSRSLCVCVCVYVCVCMCMCVFASLSLSLLLPSLPPPSQFTWSILLFFQTSRSFTLCFGL